MLSLAVSGVTGAVCAGEDISYEMGREMMKAMAGISTDEPHRFDIDKL